MRSLKKFKDLKLAEKIAGKINAIVSKKRTVMIAGSEQASALIKYRLKKLIEEKVNIVYGPGCAACFTPVEMIDKAVSIALQKDVIMLIYPEILHIPGSKQSLYEIQNNGRDVRIINSPLESVKTAEEDPKKKVVLFATGFETAAAVNAFTLLFAQKKGIKNLSILSSQIIFHACLEEIVSSSSLPLDGILIPGDLCTITGYDVFEPVSQKYKIPLVVGGHEPVDIIMGIYLIAKQIEENQHKVENQYSRGTISTGNDEGKKIISQIFEVVSRNLRDTGNVLNSTLKIKKEFTQFDAEKIFSVKYILPEVSVFCISGKIMRGLSMPDKCSVFGKICIPSHPLGSLMAATDGICSTYYKYKPDLT